MGCFTTIAGMATRKSKAVPVIDEKYACFKLEIKPSKIHRWGIYAGEDIPVRRKVIEYRGERISRRETKRRAEERPNLIYLFTLDNYWTLDGSVGGSGAEYINHCCDPNIVTRTALAMPSRMPRFRRARFVTNRSSPMRRTDEPRRSVMVFQPCQSSSASGSSIEVMPYF